MKLEAIENEVLSFWFGPEPIEPRVVWFQKDPNFDAAVAARFGSVHEAAASGALDAMAVTPFGCLALVILLDQFPRNLFRDDPWAFATDRKALNLTRLAIEKGFDREMNELQRQFLYMPYQHSEDLDEQRRSVALFAGLDKQTHEYAVRHYEIIERFGRFPHRNDILGRDSTEAEMQFLTEPNSSF
ncbi:MAG: DUF924 family protein [Alphaproteobacteria bacterium]|nr:DUF924 family protein [Alphaproteobacteria bacterium]